MTDTPRVIPRARALCPFTSLSLLLATMAGTSGCLGGAFLFPRFDFGSAPDSGQLVRDAGSPGRTRVRTGVDTGQGLPALPHAARGGRQGVGGAATRAWARAGTASSLRPPCAGTGAIAASGDKTLTTLVDVDPSGGTLRWAEELDLPAPAWGGCR